MLAPELAEARAEQLLAEHLSTRERAEYAAAGRVTVVKRGVLWSILLRELAKVLPLAALLALPGWRLETLIVIATVVFTFTPFWLPRFAIASARRRYWILSARSPPMVRARGWTIRFCAAFQEYLPAADRILAWKHVIEASEAHFLRTANVLGWRRERMG